jgi:tricorn protease
VFHPRRLALAAGLLAAWTMRPESIAGQRAADAVEPLPSFSEPAISPDRAEIAVVSGGDIWTVPSAGGDARLLVSHEAQESRPIYAPGGDRIAFVSDRTGGGDIYVLSLKSGALTQVTADDGLERLDAWSRDGRWLYFSSTGRDVAGMNDLYRVRPEGGTPMLVSADRYTGEFFAAPSPDGKKVAFAARGNSAAQWWRKGHSHLDESELWLLHDETPARYERLMDRGAKQMWPMWSGDGGALFFVSDRSGAQNVWRLPLGGAAAQVTRFTDGRVLWPTISYDGRTIVFERDFEIWALDTGKNEARKIPIAKRGLPPGPAIDHVTLNSQFQDLALSPDGRKVVFVARGEIWAAGARDGGDAVRVTRTYAREAQIEWTPDSRTIVYVSERDQSPDGAAVPRLFRYDFTTSRETQLTNGPTGDAAPRVSPDGKSVAFVRDGKELRTIDLASKQERLLASGHLSRAARGVAWSPDSRWVAYLGLTGSFFRNLHVVPAAGGESRAISAMPNSSANNISWSPDGTYVLYNTSQRTETGEVVRVDLIPRTPKFREDRFRDLFKPEPARDETAKPRPSEGRGAPADRDRDAPPPRDPSTPVEIVFDDVRRRLSILPVGVDVTSQVISPDGRWLLLTASAEGQQNLYTYSLDELSREPAVARQLTSTAGAKSDAQFSPDSREVYYLEQGRVSAMPIETRTARTIAISAEVDVDFAQEKMEVFRQAWTYMRDGFYDDKFHGVDWNAVRKQYAPRIAGGTSRTDSSRSPRSCRSARPPWRDRWRSANTSRRSTAWRSPRSRIWTISWRTRSTAAPFSRSQRRPRQQTRARSSCDRSRRRRRRTCSIASGSRRTVRMSTGSAADASATPT